MSTAEEIEHYFDKLWPICRSITGNGLRESLKILQEVIPLNLHEVPTGTPVFDWTIPREWNIRDAYIITPDGQKIADFQVNNLHVVNYATPIDRELVFEELEPHLHTLPDMPEAIPYITSYYRENWGFCISHNQFESLPREGTYRVVIDSTLEDGALTYGELVIPGETDREILFSTYVCHPSMANNELSGPLVAAFLYRKIMQMKKRRYTYRFVFAPETVGVIAFLSKFGMDLKDKLEAGYVLTCCGDSGDFVYKQSKRGNSAADRIAEHVLRHQDVPYKVIPFSIGGSDERQYCSPGFNFPVGSLTRSMYKFYKEYHTSLDNKDFISFEAMEKTVETYFLFAQTMELNQSYTNAIPYCEPQLGKRDMYPAMGAWISRTEYLYDLLHFLSYADGTIDLVDIADKRNRPAWCFEEVIQNCTEKGMI